MGEDEEQHVQKRKNSNINTNAEGFLCYLCTSLIIFSPYGSLGLSLSSTVIIEAGAEQCFAETVT